MTPKVKITRINVSPDNMYVVSVVSCIAKKYECQQPQARFGNQDLDAVITTRELIKMIEDAHINFSELPEGRADQLMSTVSVEEIRFGVTSGIMEAALKVTYELLSGEELDHIDFTPVPGMEAVKEAKLEIPLKQLGKKMPVNVCIIPELKYVDQVINDVFAGRSKYHFIEVLSCSGGCINGGGLPFLLEEYAANA